MKFQHPTNGYIEEVNHAPLWCLLFGPAYFAVKGCWTHVVASLLLALGTAGLSWLVYPFFATKAVAKGYLRNGWIPVSSLTSTTPTQPPAPLPEPTQQHVADNRSSAAASALAVFIGGIWILGLLATVTVLATIFIPQLGTMGWPELAAILPTILPFGLFFWGAIATTRRGIRRQGMSPLGWGLAALLIVGAAAAAKTEFEGTTAKWKPSTHLAGAHKSAGTSAAPRH